MTGWFCASTLLNIGDRYFIQWLRGPTEVGVYSANYSLINGAIGLLCAPILLAAHPLLMRAWNSGNEKQTAIWIANIIERFIVWGVFLTGFMFLFSRQLALLLLGESYREGNNVMPVVMFGLVAYQIGMYAHKPLEFAEQTKKMLYVASASVILNAVMNFVLIDRYGYLGAAYSTAISYMFYSVVIAKIGRKILAWKLNTKVILGTVLSNVVLILIIFELETSIMPRPSLKYSILLSTTYLVLGVLIMARNGYLMDLLVSFK